MELPRLEALWKQYGGKGLSIVAVEARRDRDRALKFIKEKNLTYHMLEGDEGDTVVGKTFRIQAFPTSFLIDRNGKIIYCHVGFEKGDEANLEKEILELAAR